MGTCVSKTSGQSYDADITMVVGSRRQELCKSSRDEVASPLYLMTEGVLNLRPEVPGEHAWTGRGKELDEGGGAAHPGVC